MNTNRTLAAVFCLNMYILVFVALTLGYYLVLHWDQAQAWIDFMLS